MSQAGEGTRTPDPAAGRIPWPKLADGLTGRLVLPHDDSYTIASQLELGQFDPIRPQAVAYCTSAADVAAAVRFAREQGLAVAVRSGGHSYGGYSTTSGLIIDLSRLNQVTVGDGVVTIGPGAQAVQVLAALAPHHLVVSEGGCPTVATGGFLGSGGFGFLTRLLGMACDAVTSAEVVLADGSIVTASAREHEDLFWAIRGGGSGNFGVIVSFQVTPRAGDMVAASTLVFPYDRAADVLDGFCQWLVDTPRTIGGGAYIQQEDAAPGSVPNLVAMLASLGTAEELAAETARLSSLAGPPVFQQDGVLPYRDLMMTVFQCPGLTPEQCQRAGKSAEGQLTRPAFGLERTRMATAPWRHAVWQEVMTAFDTDRMAGQARYLDLHMFGGAAGDPGRGDTAYVHRDALFSVNYRVLINDPHPVTTQATAVATNWVNRGFATIDPHSSGETHQNWMDPELTDWRESYYAENYQRLRQVKAAYDPGWFLRFPQGIEPA